ncbi:DUF3010 family protein [Halarcobacter anaerophilus]|uniref:DUF3010 domain-containing protein n=1 Tax=Halarcobacter anaerophilus TaxID=877500 RepID=A0A4V1LQ91_9BACT|nr:DUF3010 family protein [Halarcobacter anaerophilus]QDF27521.1 DUF3010 domain-containing protein [Halarcobacter anaerophilus]RXJ63878.1 hypothetical protein CRV06_02740 [Halarcobacter anaerophilus]
MNICGIELKSNYAVLVVLKDKEFIDLKIKKIVLGDDEKQDSIRTFCNEFLLFLEKNEIEKIYIKKRAKKGTFAGGANTFKIEALIQLNPICEVNLISAQTISSFEKKNTVTFPENLKKYQEQAYLTLLSSL